MSPQHEQTFRLPDLGEGLTEAEIVRWLVEPGDVLVVDQPVAEVETAKALVEVVCPYAGSVLRLHGDPGQVLPVGSPLVSVAGPAGAGGSAAPTVPAQTATGPTAAATTEQASGTGSGNVLVGYGTVPAGRRRRRVHAGPQPSPGHPAAPERHRAAPAQRPAVVSPVVRRLAREHGVDLTALTGSGTHGLIVRRDVEQAIESPRPAAGLAQPTGERIPLRGARRAAAERFVRSRREIPDATCWVDVDATDLLAAREQLNNAGTGPRIGLLSLLARFCVAGLRRHRELNSFVDTDRSELVLLDRIHLGFAAQTDRGLVVPVVRDAQDRSLEQLAAEIERLTEAARAGRLSPAELTGSTFTLNNYGVFGVDGADAIINHPEAAILGVGRIIDRPWVVDGELTVRKVSQLSLSFDHRVCDGGVAGGFLRQVADLVESPYRLLRQV